MTKAQLQQRMNRLVDSFLSDIDRARQLFTTLVVEGGVDDPSGDFRYFDQPTRRDITQFLFFEVAASWEHLAKELFFVAVEYFYDTSPQKAEFIAGRSRRWRVTTGGMDTVRSRQCFGAKDGM